MRLRYISLRAEYGVYDDTFFHVFMDNVRFISNYLSRRIRCFHIETDGTYDMISVSITNSQDSCSLESGNVLAVKIHFDEESLKMYLKMKEEILRFEFYLSILEKGYIIASKHKDIPLNILLDLQQEFRTGNYLNERIFKTRRINDFGIIVELFHCLSSYDYKLKINVYNSKKELIGKGVIFKTLPDETLYDKKVRNLTTDGHDLIVTDFLEKPQFVGSLTDLCKGIVKFECVDEKTKQYIPNDKNKEQFERLKWQ